MGSGLERCSAPAYGELYASQMGRGLCRKNREDIWLHCFAQCAFLHHSQLNGMGRLLQMISHFLSSLQHFSLAPAPIPFCSQELQGWQASSSDRWWISPCAGSVLPLAEVSLDLLYFLCQCVNQSCSHPWLYLRPSI